MSHPMVHEILDLARRALDSDAALFLVVQYPGDVERTGFLERLGAVLEAAGFPLREFDPENDPEHGTEKLYPLLARASEEGAICLVRGLIPNRDGNGPDEDFLHYLNLYRDRIAHERIRLILMAPEQWMEAFLLAAGDLWDFRQKTFWLESPARQKAVLDPSLSPPES